MLARIIWGYILTCCTFCSSYAAPQLQQMASGSRIHPQKNHFADNEANIWQGHR